MAQLFHVGIKALCKNKSGQYLVLEVDPAQFRDKSKPGHWDIPGGRIEGDDSVEVTLRREIKEELGIDMTAKPEFFTAVLSNIKLPHGDTDEVRLALMIYTLLLPDNAEFKLSEENLRYEWVDATTAKERLSFKYPKEFTEKLI